MGRRLSLPPSLIFHRSIMLRFFSTLGLTFSGLTRKYKLIAKEGENVHIDCGGVSGGCGEAASPC